jgi:hypothetical protein
MRGESPAFLETGYEQWIFSLDTISHHGLGFRPIVVAGRVEVRCRRADGMNGPNGFFWLLIAFPVYLLASGKLTGYIQLLGATAGTGTTKAQTGLNNNQAIV